MAEPTTATTTPSFTSQYCNGSKSPPELGAAGYAVPPGVNEFNAFPNPVFTLNPAGVVDEGNNWVNVSWGPLALTSPATNAVLGNYAPVGSAAQSSAVDHGSATPAAGTGTTTVPAPKDDFFGNIRPAGNGYDIGAVEVGALPPLPKLAVTPATLTFSAAVGYPSAVQNLTLSNTGNVSSNLGALVFSNATYTRATGTQAGSCGASLAGGTTCTIGVVFTPTAGGPSNGTVAIAADVAVTGSPVTLNGTGAAANPAATLTPATWTTARARNCPGTGCAGDPSQIFTLRNTGNVPLTGVTNAVLSGTPANLANWALVPNLSTCGPAGNGQFSANTTLAPNVTCLIVVQFKPLTGQAAGSKAVTLSVKEAAGTLALTQTAALNGTAQ